MYFFKLQQSNCDTRLTEVGHEVTRSISIGNLRIAESKIESHMRDFSWISSYTVMYDIETRLATHIQKLINRIMCSTAFIGLFLIHCVKNNGIREHFNSAFPIFTMIFSWTQCVTDWWDCVWLQLLFDTHETYQVLLYLMVILVLALLYHSKLYWLQ